MEHSSTGHTLNCTGLTNVSERNEHLATRVSKLELGFSLLERDILDIRKSAVQMEETLIGLQRNIQQIKWIAVGAGGTFLINSLGLLPLIQKLLGIVS